MKDAIEQSGHTKVMDYSLSGSEKEILEKLLTDERIGLGGLSQDELAYLIRRVVRLSNARREGNARGVVRMSVVTTILISLFSLLSMVYDSEGRPLEWAAAPRVAYLSNESPIESTQVEEAIDYVVWSWRSRIPELDIRYVGITAGPIENAIITYRWLGEAEHYNITHDFNVRGIEQSWIYLDSGYIARSVISLNAAYFRNGIGACEMLVFSHELGHALGASHSKVPDSLMYAAPSHCRPVPTDADVRATGYTPSTCHVELTREFDLYLPEINGMEAYLKYQGNMIWILDYLGKNSTRVCRENQFTESTGELKLDKIKGRFETYKGSFKALGEGRFQLERVEEFP